MVMRRAAVNHVAVKVDDPTPNTNSLKKSNVLQFSKKLLELLLSGRLLQKSQTNGKSLPH